MVATSIALPALLACIAPACSTTHAEADAGNGAGGSGGAGGAAGDQGAVDAGPLGVPFSCGDASCTTGSTYCRAVSAPGGQTGSNGTTFVVTYSCPPLNADCAARDCTCVTESQGVYFCPSNQCSVLDAGAVIAACDKI
jgi:hypothetical protein